MNTIRLLTNQHQLIANLRHAFTPQSMLGELLQNARRAQANHIEIIVDGDTLIVRDDGTGIADLQALIHIAESGWDEELKARENAFGLGVLSTLYFARQLSVHSRSQMFSSSTTAIIQGEAIPLHPAASRQGTEIRLDGVQSPRAGQELHEWVERELTRLCEAFPVPVSINGAEVARPLANPALHWRQTDMGRVLLNLSASRLQWRCFLQGLPIGRNEHYDNRHVVLLPDHMLARLPDRQVLLNEAEDHRHIQVAIDLAYRAALLEEKARLAASDFVLLHAQTCLDSSNADLLNDVPFVPRAWFRNWEFEPAGFVHHWERQSAEGLVSRAVLEECGVWQIDVDWDNDYRPEVYLEAAGAFLLEQHRLDTAHWLTSLVRSVSPEQIQVRMGAILHRDSNPGLADYEVELELVEAIHLWLEGGPEHTVQAVRKGNTLYLTPDAGERTEFVSDYIFDDRYEEPVEEEDAKTILTFIAVGCSDEPERVLNALLPKFLSFRAQPKLANAVVCLTFDAEGKLHTVR